jgi:hypothetical protein
MFVDVFNNVFFQWVHFSCFNSWLMITSQYLPTSLRAVLLVTEYNAATNIPEMVHQFISFISNQRQIFPYKTCKSLLLSRSVTDIGVGILLVLLARIVNIKFIIL